MKKERVAIYEMCDLRPNFSLFLALSLFTLPTKKPSLLAQSSDVYNCDITISNASYTTWTGLLTFKNTINNHFSLPLRILPISLSLSFFLLRSTISQSLTQNSLRKPSSTHPPLNPTFESCHLLSAIYTEP